MANISLLSNTARVEIPFVGVRMGEYTFGIWEKSLASSTSLETISKVRYPNYVTGLRITKVNGTVNTYTLTMKYVIRAGDDPNFLEKVFSSISKTREMYLSYGDLSTPIYIYKEEKVLITRITSNLDINSSSITYTISAISTAMLCNSSKFFFPKIKIKGSDQIKKILYDERYGLLDIFYGMKNKDLVATKGLIAGDDRVVELEERNEGVLSYLNYVVNCMSDIVNTDNTLIKKGRYTFLVYDDITSGFEGPYFKVVKAISSTKSQNSLDIYDIDIGYPNDKNAVISFTLDDNETYSLLYDYSQKVAVNDYVYRIDQNGKPTMQYSPSLSASPFLKKTTEADKTWWSQVTQYPIRATLTIKGLLRPAMLMTYVRVHSYFYGREHLSSGTYIVTKQVDDISASGYRTQLSLTRIAAETELT